MSTSGKRDIQISFWKGIGMWSRRESRERARGTPCKIYRHFPLLIQSSFSCIFCHYMHVCVCVFILCCICVLWLCHCRECVWFQVREVFEVSCHKGVTEYWDSEYRCTEEALLNSWGVRQRRAEARNEINNSGEGRPVRLLNTLGGQTV